MTQQDKTMNASFLPGYFAGADMDDQRLEQIREHHLSVSIAKFLFHHSRHGIVAVRDPIRLADARQYGLTPIVLYSITAAGLPIRWLSFSTLEQRKPFFEVLTTAWTQAKGLRGKPDVVRVHKYLSRADPGLADDLAGIEVRLEFADAKDKTVSAALRWAQDKARWLRRSHPPTSSSLTAGVEALCLDAQISHAADARCQFHASGDKKLEDRIKRWTSLPIREPTPLTFADRPWTEGPWLASWETSVPPGRQRHFHFDPIEGRMMLLLGNEPSAEERDHDDYETPICPEHDNTPEIAGQLLECWPNALSEISSALGITLRNLKWFTEGKITLDEEAHYALRKLLGIDCDDRTGFYRPCGPYVLIAKKLKAIQEIYDQISEDGDAAPYELVPLKEAADPSWRYILINTYGRPPSIIMVPRGDTIAERIPDLLANYQGIKPVSPTLFRAVVSTCAKACMTPADNVRESSAFARYFDQY